MCVSSTLSLLYLKTLYIRLRVIMMISIFLSGGCFVFVVIFIIALIYCTVAVRRMFGFIVNLRRSIDRLFSVPCYLYFFNPINS